MREKEIDEVVTNTAPHEVEAPGVTSELIPSLNEPINTALSLESEPSGSEDK